MATFKKFKNVKSKESDSQFGDIYEAFDFIKGNRPNLDKIMQLRQMQKGTTEFQKLKETLPCIMWNFDTNGGRKSDSVVDSTGYLYYDIDYMDESDLNINMDYVYAKWKSVSETGFGLLVKVEGLNLQNFKSAQQGIAKSLNIPFDNGAKDAVRLNILSYDPNIWINEDAETCDCTGFINEETETETENSQPINLQSSLLMSGDWADDFSRLRFSNLEEKKAGIAINYDDNGVCDLEGDKMPYTEIYIPFASKISDGNSNATLSAICIKIICLNPTASFKRILATMKSINQKICLNPKSENALEHIVKTAYKNRDNFKLKSNKDKRFFFEDPLLPLKQRKSLAMTYINRRKSRLRRREVCDCINEMDENGETFRIADIERNCQSSPNTIKDILDKMSTEQLPKNLINRQKFL